MKNNICMSKIFELKDLESPDPSFFNWLRIVGSMPFNFNGSTYVFIPGYLVTLFNNLCDKYKVKALECHIV